MRSRVDTTDVISCVLRERQPRRSKRTDTPCPSWGPCRSRPDDRPALAAQRHRTGRGHDRRRDGGERLARTVRRAVAQDRRADRELGRRRRSEEHTSELQSLMRISYAVFCFKTKNHITPQPNMQSLTHHLLSNKTLTT